MIIATASDAADLLVPLFASAAVERVVTVYLGEDRRLIATQDSEGGEDSEIELPIRGILIEALRLRACGLIVAHNHPSGDCTPSAADLAATRRLAEAAAALGIQLHDHLIVGGDGDCRSFRALGLL